MTKAEASLWRERWRLVNNHVIEEARALTPDQRLRQLASLFDFAHRVRKECDDHRQVEQARSRWLRLKEQSGE